jgi:transposase-like protein
MERAIHFAASNTVSDAARLAGVNVTALRSALRNAGQPPRIVPNSDAMARAVTTYLEGAGSYAAVADVHGVSEPGLRGAVARRRAATAPSP